MANGNPLEVLIVGGGIGGLTAAIALRRQGHNVQIFEQSHLASEIGAAVTVFPNADSVLKRLGIDVATCGGNYNTQIRIINSSGKVLHVTDNTRDAHRWQGATRCVHRAHFHEHLKQVALSPEGIGPPVQLHKAMRIRKVDAENATILHYDGSSIKGDLLVGADGVHSITRSEIDPTIEAYKSHESAFRFIMTREAALEDPATRELASILGSMDMWYGEDRKVIMYPCADNKILNFVCVHPAELSGAEAKAGYDTKASKEQLLEVYKDFSPALQAFLMKAQPDTIKFWPLWDMKQLPTFIRGRMALIGDAAHPFLPHLGQGAAQAIQDGVALATMLPSGVDKSEVPERLRLYNEARFKLASSVQHHTRLAGGDTKKNMKDSASDISVFDFMQQATSHDEFHHSTQILRQYQWKQRAHASWRQPISFGPMPSLPQPSTQPTCRTATISFKTSATLLRNLFPTNYFRFKGMDTVAYASFRLQTFEHLPQLAGHGHHAFGLYIHNVVYGKQDGSAVEGTYIPVQFDDSVDVILADREGLGLPKFYSVISAHQENERMYVELRSWGVTWARMEILGLVNEQQATDENVKGEKLLVHKYIPSTGQQGKTSPDADYAVQLESEIDDPRAGFKKRQMSKGEAWFQFDAHDPERLPNLHHIVSRLAEIPSFEVVEASVVETMGTPNVLKAKRIE